MEGAVAPIFWGNIGNCFSEIPTVPKKIPSVILAFAIWVLCRFGNNDRAVLPRTFAVTPSIFDSDLSDVGVVWHNIAFRNSEAAIPSFHLDSVIGDA